MLQYFPNLSDKHFFELIMATANYLHENCNKDNRKNEMGEIVYKRYQMVVKNILINQNNI